MNPGISIRFDTQETRKSPPHHGGDGEPFYPSPKNFEQSGDVVATATTEAVKVGTTSASGQSGHSGSATQCRLWAQQVPYRPQKEIKGRPREGPPLADRTTC